MSMMVSFVLSFFPRDVLDEILNLIESVSEDFPSYSTLQNVLVSIMQVQGHNYKSYVFSPTNRVIKLNQFNQVSQKGQLK